MPRAKLSPDARRTLSMELRRAPAIGVLETAFTTFGILILIKVFDAGSGPKAMLLGSARAGLIASILVVPLLHRCGVSLPKLVALIHCLGGVGFIWAAFDPDSLTAVVAGISFGLFSFALQTPLLTQLYRANLPDLFRGRLFSLIGLVRAISSIIFAYLGGRLLGVEMQFYQYLLFGFAGCAFYSAVLFSRLPYPEDSPAPRPIFGAFQWLRDDSEFRLLIICWMILGLGNLMAMSLFVEYLANPKYGFALAAATIAVLTGVVPPMVKLFATYPCGALFDRMNFYRLRIFLNCILLSMILTFYLGGGIVGACLGLCLQGIALAGGNIIWSLWVTRIAPAERVAEYMSIHTFMTGLRGTVAPFLAYALIDRVSVSTFTWICASMVIVATVMLIPRAIRAETGNPTDSPGPQFD